jgi:hypothetical protein
MMIILQKGGKSRKGDANFQKSDCETKKLSGLAREPEIKFDTQEFLKAER